MKRITPITCLIVLLPLLVATGQESGTASSSQVQTVFSTNGKMKVQFNPDEQPDIPVWLTSTNQPEKRKQLGETFFYVQEVSISPENNWIVVKNGTASAGTSLIVFRRTHGLEYKKAGEIHPEAALKMLIAGKKIPRDFKAAHLHASLVGWLDEETGSFVLNVSGDGGGGGGQTHYLNWLCAYNPGTGKIASLNQKILEPIKDH